MKTKSVGVEKVRSVTSFPAFFFFLVMFVFCREEKLFDYYVIWDNISGLSVDNCHIVGT